jgi:hypothetical protein
LTALGKCINCLAEGTAHVPYRDSKLTRLMKDSFGGTARTSLIVCVSPLRDHVSETTSALQFGQRAMTITNSTRIREEVVALPRHLAPPSPLFALSPSSPPPIDAPSHGPFVVDERCRRFHRLHRSSHYSSGLKSLFA